MHKFEPFLLHKLVRFHQTIPYVIHVFVSVFIWKVLLWKDNVTLLKFTHDLLIIFSQVSSDSLTGCKLCGEVMNQIKLRQQPVLQEICFKFNIICHHSVWFHLYMCRYHLSLCTWKCIWTDNDPSETELWVPLIYLSSWAIHWIKQILLQHKKWLFFQSKFGHLLCTCYNVIIKRQKIISSYHCFLHFNN